METDVYDLEKETAEVSKLRRKKARQERDDVRWLMGHKAGRRIVWGLLEDAGVYKTSFSTDTHVTAFQEGKRNQGIQLVAKLNIHCLDAYNLMVKEHLETVLDQAMVEFL